MSAYKYLTAQQAKQQGYTVPTGDKGIWIDSRVTVNGRKKVIPKDNCIKNSNGTYISLNRDGTSSLLMDKNKQFTAKGARKSAIDRMRMQMGGGIAFGFLVQMVV